MAGAEVWRLPERPAPGSDSGADEALADELLPLVVGLCRSERLGSTLQQFKVNAGEEVKAAVQQVVAAVLPVLLAAAGDALPAQQAHHGTGSELQAMDQLQVCCWGC
jgi:hypothetical protein